MNTSKRLTRLTLLFVALVVASLSLVEKVSAAGISVDAGLTPAENRLIFRTQMRFMQRDNHPTQPRMEMKSYMFPVVIAYGVRPDLAVMIRQVYRRNEVTTMMGDKTTKTGLTDLFILGKYRLARINKPNYTLGVAPTLGLEIPSGNKGFTSNTWNLHLGCFVSGRIGSWGADLNASYKWKGLAKTGRADRDPGDEFSFEGALANQFSLGGDADFALAPVLEFTFVDIASDTKDGSTLANSGESVFLLSPGLKVTWSSLIFESLIQFPLWQNQNGQQTERGPSLIIGFRLMS